MTVRGHIWKASGFALWGLLNAPMAYAQTTAPAPASQPSDNDKLLPGEIIVTAQKRSELLSRVPAAIIAVAGDKLAATGVNDVRNLDKSVTGVMFSSNGTVVSASIRGIGSTQYSPLGGPAVGTNIDGVPIDGMIAPNAVFYDIDRVEVLKGPQGTLYGRNSTAGVINIVSHHPVLGTLSGAASAEIGNYDSRKVEASVNLPLGSISALRVSGLYSAHDGFMSNGYNDANDYAVRAQFLLQPSDAFHLLVAADYFHQGGRGVTDIPLPLGTRGTDADHPYNQQYYPNPTDAYQNNHTFGIRAEAVADLGFATLTVIPAYRKLQRDQVSYQASFRTAVDDNDEQKSVEARLAGSTGAVKWLLGGYIFDDIHRYDADYANPSSCAGLDIQRYTAGDCITLNGNRARLLAKSQAAFAQVTFSVTDAFRLTGGLRYTHDTRSAAPNVDYTVFPFPGGPPVLMGVPAYPAPAVPNLVNNPLVGLITENATGSFNNVSYKFGAEYDAGQYTVLYANITSGYKSGGVNDGNSTLYKPEKLYSYEAGIRTQLFDRRLRLHLNAFYWDYKDHQEGGVYFVPPVGILYQVTNIAKGKIYGADLEADLRLTSNDTLGAQIAYLKSDTGPFSLPTGISSPNGHPYINSPTWTLNLNYSHRFEIGEWTLEPAVQTHLVSSYNVDFRFDAATRQPGYHKTDLTLTLRPGGNRWYVGVYVRNIENKAVLTSAQAAPGIGAPKFWGFIGDPRTYGARLGVTF